MFPYSPTPVFPPSASAAQSSREGLEGAELAIAQREGPFAPGRAREAPAARTLLEAAPVYSPPHTVPNVKGIGRRVWGDFRTSRISSFSRFASRQEARCFSVRLGLCSPQILQAPFLSMQLSSKHTKLRRP